MRKSWKLRLWTSSERRIPKLWSLIADIGKRLEPLTEEIESECKPDQGIFTSISLVSKCNPWATFFRRILGVFARDERIWYPGCHRLPFSRDEEEKQIQLSSKQTGIDAFSGIKFLRKPVFEDHVTSSLIRLAGSGRLIYPKPKPRSVAERSYAGRGEIKEYMAFPRTWATNAKGKWRKFGV